MNTIAITFEAAKEIGLNILLTYDRVTIFEFGVYDLHTSLGKNDLIAKFL